MFNTGNALDKGISLSGSNKTGFWGRIPQPPEANGRCRDFTDFF